MTQENMTEKNVTEKSMILYKPPRFKYATMQPQTPANMQGTSVPLKSNTKPHQ
jgi:hypothetical protein